MSDYRPHWNWRQGFDCLEVEGPDFSAKLTEGVECFHYQIFFDNMRITSGSDLELQYVQEIAESILDDILDGLKEMLLPVQESDGPQLELSDWKFYRKTARQEMRPYIPGEDLTGISVNKEDTPEPGGMIARNSDNHEDQWYVDRAFFEKNYESVA